MSSGPGYYEGELYNVIRNGYLGSSVDDNHDDGFQSWSVGEGGVGTGEVRGVVRLHLGEEGEDPAVEIFHVAQRSHRGRDRVRRSISATCGGVLS